MTLLPLTSTNITVFSFFFFFREDGIRYIPTYKMSLVHSAQPKNYRLTMRWRIEEKTYPYK